MQDFTTNKAPGRVCILTVGTEITTGQVKNSNATWIANQLTNQGLAACLHVSVADLDKDIIDALNFSEQLCELIIVTGGLGPTSDDLTRQSVSAWCQSELLFHDDLWEKLQLRFQRSGFKNVLSNKRQCFFPKGAQIIHNHHGTAHGFRVKKGMTHCICLPGPPSEIAGIWHDYVSSILKELFGNQAKAELLRFHTVGHLNLNLLKLLMN